MQNLRRIKELIQQENNSKNHPVQSSNITNHQQQNNKAFANDSKKRGPQYYIETDQMPHKQIKNNFPQFHQQKIRKEQSKTIDPLVAFYLSQKGKEEEEQQQLAYSAEFNSEVKAKEKNQLNKKLEQKQNKYELQRQLQLQKRVVAEHQEILEELKKQLQLQLQLQQETQMQIEIEIQLEIQNKYESQMQLELRSGLDISSKSPQQYLQLHQDQMQKNIDQVIGWVEKSQQIQNKNKLQLHNCLSLSVNYPMNLQERFKKQEFLQLLLNEQAKKLKVLIEQKQTQLNQQEKVKQLFSKINQEAQKEPQ